MFFKLKVFGGKVASALAPIVVSPLADAAALAVPVTPAPAPLPAADTTAAPAGEPAAPWYSRVWNAVKTGAGAVWRVLAVVAREGKTLGSLAVLGLGGLFDQFGFYDIITYAKEFLGDGAKTGGIIAGIVGVYFAVKLMRRFVSGTAKPGSRGIEDDAGDDAGDLVTRQGV